jgi:hypothetical protein
MEDIENLYKQNYEFSNFPTSNSSPDNDDYIDEIQGFGHQFPVKRLSEKFSEIKAFKCLY